MKIENLIWFQDIIDKLAFKHQVKPGEVEEVLPSFRSNDELVAFFESHDMGEYWEQLPKAKVEVSLTKKLGPDPAVIRVSVGQLRSSNNYAN